MDAFPVLSQVKSFVQAVFGDSKGAIETQINFSRRCPVVSQIRSAVEALTGDEVAAQQTQKECGMFVLSLVEGTPLVGHAMGTVYYIAGNRERGDEAMKNASRSSAVIAGGVLGFVGGGPGGAIVGSNIGGAAMDGLISGIDSAVHKSFRPFGILTPTNDPKNVGKWVDAVFLIGGDSFTGYTIGRTLSSRTANAGSFKDELVKNSEIMGEISLRGDVQQVGVGNIVLTHQTSFMTRVIRIACNCYAAASSLMIKVVAIAISVYVIFYNVAVHVDFVFKTLNEGYIRVKQFYKMLEKSQLVNDIMTLFKSGINKTDDLKEGNKTDAPNKENKTDALKEGNKTDALKEGNKTDALKEGNKTDALKEGNKTDAPIPKRELFASMFGFFIACSLYFIIIYLDSLCKLFDFFISN